MKDMKEDLIPHKEDYFRYVVLGGIREDALRSLRPFGGWAYRGARDYGGFRRHVFAHQKKECEVLFAHEGEIRERDIYKGDIYRCSNVLPINSANVDHRDYEKGFDSAQNPALSLTQDVLYDFCLQFNTMAGKANSGTYDQWWCAIIPSASDASRNFIHALIEEDLAPGGQYEGMTVHTRFPPEPNGYLHIGHCKALTIDFGTAEKYGGLCNLRMDDTNPTKEDEEFVEAIKEDIHWLGFDWGDRFFYGSDYFEEDYRQAVGLIQKGLAYVCQLSQEEFKEYRGAPGVPARSPWRERPVEESLDLFARMRAGEFPDGAMTLRAKIDLASNNFNMRDPVIYRIKHISHHRQGDKWCIYPMYDFAHPIQDALEGITHSLCSLEYENHRPLYNWVVEHCDLPSKPRQIEFARLGIDHTVMSKRKLRSLVEGGQVSGWDDPRMPTLCGLRRRGYTPRSIRNFCERIGVAKVDSVVKYDFLEHCLREDLNETARRVMAVLRPVKLIVTNYPEGQTETVAVENNPLDPSAGSRSVTFSRELWVEAEDFLQKPVPKYKRLYPGGPECRLKGAYLIRCTGCETDAEGNVTAVLCTYDPESRGGDPADGRKVKGATLHWVNAADAVEAEVRLYDNLFSDDAPDEAGKDYMACLNPASLEVLRGCRVEAGLKDAEAPASYQFLRQGYFCLDSRDSRPGALVFNRSVSLKDRFRW